MVHQNFMASPETLLKVLAPFRDDVVVAVEWIFTWYWLADLGAREGLPFVLGHALDKQAIHGVQAKHDSIDAQKIAVLLRGGILPQSYVYPAEMRATRELLRRRIHFMRKRAELLTHVQNTTSQDHLPAIDKKIAHRATRDGVAERFPAPGVQKSIAPDLTLIGHDDRLLRDVELSILTTATPHDANTLSLPRTVPGSGEILSLVLLDEIHNSQRFPHVQDVVSSCRLVKCAKASAGKRDGTSGRQMGNASLTWAFSEAAVLFLRTHPAGQTQLARLEKTHVKGQPLTVLAHKLARAVYSMLQRQAAFDMHKFLSQ